MPAAASGPALGAVALSLGGCFQQEPQIDQANLCTYSTDSTDTEAKLCKDGQLSWFKPARRGNEHPP